MITVFLMADLVSMYLYPLYLFDFVYQLMDVLNFNFQMCTQFLRCFFILSQYLLLAKIASNFQTFKILNVYLNDLYIQNFNFQFFLASSKF